MGFRNRARLRSGTGTVFTKNLFTERIKKKLRKPDLLRSVFRVPVRFRRHVENENGVVRYRETEKTRGSARMRSTKSAAILTKPTRFAEDHTPKYEVSTDTVTVPVLNCVASLFSPNRKSFDVFNKVFHLSV
jgi:hypothetical protein